MTNATFGFETSPNTNPKKKKWGDMAYYVPPTSKSGGTRPPPNCAHDLTWKILNTKHDKTNATFGFETSPNTNPKKKKVGGHIPRVPHQIVPRFTI